MCTRALAVSGAVPWEPLPWDPLWACCQWWHPLYWRFVVNRITPSFVGGVLTGGLGWRSTLWACAVIGAVMFTATLVLLPETLDPKLMTHINFNCWCQSERAVPARTSGCHCDQCGQRNYYSASEGSSRPAGGRQRTQYCNSL